MGVSGQEADQMTFEGVRVILFGQELFLQALCFNRIFSCFLRVNVRLLIHLYCFSLQACLQITQPLHPAGVGPLSRGPERVCLRYELLQLDGFLCRVFCVTVKTKNYTGQRAHYL